jgi:hypothetical protein
MRAKSKLVRTTLIVSGLVITLGILSMPADTHAVDPFTAVCQANNANTVCKDKARGSTNPLTGSNGIIRKIASTTALLAGITGVIMMIAAGITFMTANGEPGKTKQAEDMAKYTLVGIVIIALADSIISYVLTKL